MGQCRNPTSKPLVTQKGDLHFTDTIMITLSLTDCCRDSIVPYTDPGVLISHHPDGTESQKSRTQASQEHFIFVGRDFDFIYFYIKLTL